MYLAAHSAVKPVSAFWWTNFMMLLYYYYYFYYYISNLSLAFQYFSYLLANMYASAICNKILSTDMFPQSQ